MIHLSGFKKKQAIDPRKKFPNYLIKSYPNHIFKLLKPNNKKTKSLMNKLAKDFKRQFAILGRPMPNNTCEDVISHEGNVN